MRPDHKNTGRAAGIRCWSSELLFVLLGCGFAAFSEREVQSMPVLRESVGVSPGPTSKHTKIALNKFADTVMR